MLFIIQYKNILTLMSFINNLQKSKLTYPNNRVKNKHNNPILKRKNMSLHTMIKIIIIIILMIICFTYHC